MKTSSPRRTSLRRLAASSLTITSLLATACSTGDADSEPPEAESRSPFDEDITWHEHIAPLVVEKCTGCHSPGGIGPFSIEGYDDGKMWAHQMNRDIQNGVMPPWAAKETDECTPPGSFKDDLRLSETEKAMFAQWIADGLLEGDPKDAPEPHEPPELVLKNADRQLTIPSAVTVEGTSDAFVCFSLDPQITEPVWLNGTQMVPGNSAIAHHALLYLDRGGQSTALADETGQYPCFGGPNIGDPALLAAWAPGAVPAVTPDNVGTPLEPGDRMVVQMHYHPTGSGKETDDATRIDLRWTNEEPDYVSNILLIGNFETSDDEWMGGRGYGLTTGPDFRIPAGATDHQEINRFKMPGGEDPFNAILPLSLWMVATHMHYVGTDMKINATRPNGDDQCLIQTPAWDFNWQRGYYFEGEVRDLPAIHLGDSLTMRCTYDNSLGNPFVREALAARGLEEPVDVLLGDETLDEMCIGVFGVAVPKEFKEAIGL